MGLAVFGQAVDDQKERVRAFTIVVADLTKAINSLGTASADVRLEGATVGAGGAGDTGAGVSGEGNELRVVGALLEQLVQLWSTGPPIGQSLAATASATAQTAQTVQQLRTDQAARSREDSRAVGVPGV